MTRRQSVFFFNGVQDLNLTLYIYYTLSLSTKWIVGKLPATEVTLL